MALFNTKFITYGGPLNLPGVKLAYSSEQGNVYELENVLPKAFFVDSILVIPDGPSAFEYLKNPGRIDFSTTAVVEDYHREVLLSPRLTPLLP